MTLPLLLLTGLLQQDPSAPCRATIEWIETDEKPDPIGAPGQIRPFTLFATASPGACLPADVLLTALYFDRTGSLICSGKVEHLVTAHEPTLVAVLEFHLTNSFEFVRWRSGPIETALEWRPFQCLRPDGTGLTPTDELGRAAGIRLYATIFAGSGGMATDVMRFGLTR